MKRFFAKLYIGILLVILYAPLVFIAVFSFTEAKALGNWTGFSTHLYQSLFTGGMQGGSGLMKAVENTLICILLGYPAAYILADKQLNRSAVTIVLFILPMWINALMRTLATSELFNVLGFTLGKGTLLFGMVYDYLPFMIYPIYNILQKMDKSYGEAAEDLGATPLQVFTKVTLPLSMPGIMSGVMMVFMPTVSTFAIAEFLTNNKIKLFGTIIQENINSSMWNYGSALALIMLIIIGITSLFNSEDSNAAEGGLI